MATMPNDSMEPAECRALMVFAAVMCFSPFFKPHRVQVLVLLAAGVAENTVSMSINGHDCGDTILGAVSKYSIMLRRPSLFHVRDKQT